jgi:WD40 repeat protein
VGHATHGAFSPDGSRLALVQGDAIAVMPPFGLFVRDPGLAVTVWDPAAGRAVHKLSGHTEGARRVAFSADGTRLASGGRDGRMIVWDPAAGRKVAEYHGHAGWVEVVALSPDGRWAASAHEPKETTQARFGLSPFKTVPGTVKVWDATTGTERLTLGGHPSTVYTAAFSPDGKTLATASHDLIKLWYAATGVERGQFQGNQASGTSALVFSPDGRTLAAAAGSVIHLWDLTTGRVRCALTGHGDGRFGGLAFSPDGRRVVTAVNTEVKLWDAESGQEVLTLPLPPESDPQQIAVVVAVGFTADGRRLLAALRNGTQLAWDAAPPAARR